MKNINELKAYWNNINTKSKEIVENVLKAGNLTQSYSDFH
jgi:hypothetical protein